MSKGISQGEAVFQAVVQVLGSEPEGAVDLSKEQLKEVHNLVYQMFKAGVTEHSKKPNDEDLQRYVPGLVNNWMRKDKRLNGGMKYQAKNPGSRQGNGDASLKNMKLLLNTLVEPDAIAAVQTAIDERTAELAAAKRPAVDVEKIPEHLRHLVK